ncbi:MAG TPA: MerR family transcriptional regulator [Symbiobacteriaceae bacterium]|nr:MerR family transcriptional regulator [Symbiobacteriaceae bacterium]
MSLMSIGEVARRAGVQPSAVRYYESLGLVPAPERVGGKRRYGAETLARLNAIQMFKQAGFTMAELQVLMRSEPLPDQAALSELADRKLRELDELMSRLQVMKDLLSSVRRCGCLTVEECAILVSQDQS